MNIFRTISSFIFLIIATLSLKAQGEWSLEKCINQSFENNLQVKQQKIYIEKNENTLYESKLSYIPNFNGSVSHGINWGKSVNINDLKISDYSQSTNASINASINLLDGLSKINTVKSNRKSVDISIQEVEKIKNELSISITKAFLQVLLSKEILTATEANFKSISEQRDRTKKLVDAGSKAYSTLLDIESQMATERVQLVTASNNLKTNKLSLLQLMDMPYSEEFDIIAPSLENEIPSMTMESIDSIYSIAVFLPQIKTAELNLEKSKIDLSIAKGRFYPTISFSASYGTYFSTTVDKAFLTQFNENRNPYIGFGLNIPIFNSWSVATNVRNARLTVANSEIELKDKHQTLYKNIQLAVADAVAFYQKYIASEANLKAMEESFRYVEQKFNVGTLNSTDYTVSKANLLKAQSEYYQAKFQYIFQLKIIDFYKGTPISL
jgi:outer membrane protein